MRRWCPQAFCAVWPCCSTVLAACLQMLQCCAALHASAWQQLWGGMLAGSSVVGAARLHPGGGVTCLPTPSLSLMWWQCMMTCSSSHKAPCSVYRTLWMHVQALQPTSGQVEELRDHVLILGFGRVGQIIGQLLSERLIPFVAIDVNTERVQV